MIPSAPSLPVEAVHSVVRRGAPQARDPSSRVSDFDSAYSDTKRPVPAKKIEGEREGQHVQAGFDGDAEDIDAEVVVETTEENEPGVVTFEKDIIPETQAEVIEVSEESAGEGAPLVAVLPTEPGPKVSLPTDVDPEAASLEEQPVETVDVPVSAEFSTNTVDQRPLAGPGGGIVEARGAVTPPPPQKADVILQQDMQGRTIAASDMTMSRDQQVQEASDVPATTRAAPVMASGAAAALVGTLQKTTPLASQIKAVHVEQPSAQTQSISFGDIDGVSAPADTLILRSPATTELFNSAQMAVAVRAQADGGISDENFRKLSPREIDLADEGHALTERGGAAASRSTGAEVFARRDTPQIIANQLSLAVQRQGAGQYEVALNPPELGRVRISMEASERGMTVVISADRGETLDLMRRHVDQLEKEFRELGYDTLDFSFGSDGSQAQQDEMQGWVADRSTEASAVETDETPTQDINRSGRGLAGPAGSMDIKL